MASLAVVGVTLGRRGRLAPGAKAAVALTLVSSAVVVLHAHRPWRSQSTWLFGLRTCAGIGAGTLPDRLTPRSGPAVRVATTAAAVAALAIATLSQGPSPVATAAAIRTPRQPSDLDLVDAYLPLVADARPTGVLASFGGSDLFAWTTHEVCRCEALVDQPPLDLVESRSEVSARVTA